MMCRVETQREAPTVLVGRPTVLGGREREARMGEFGLKGGLEGKGRR